MNNNKYIILTLFFSVIISFILMLIKGYAWSTTFSLSIKASLVDSLLDGMTSLINLFAFKHALKPADYDHKWGHGKSEALATFIQSILIAISAFILIYDIFINATTPKKIIDSNISLILMGCVSALTLILVVWQNFIIRKTKSLILKSDTLHYETDLMANAAVLFSLVLSMKFKFIYVDIIIALIIAFYILYSSWSIFWKSCHILMDRELDEEIQTKILNIISNYPNIKKIHDLRTRSSGQKYFIQFGIDFTQDLSIKEVKKIIQEISQDIEQSISLTEVMIFIPKSLS